MRIEKLRSWGAAVDKALCLTFNGERDAIKAEVERGESELWRLNDGQAWMVTHVAGDVLTVCCFQGRGLRAIAPAVVALARRNGARRIRYASASPALARLLRPLRFAPRLTIYEADVSTPGGEGS